MGVYSTIHICIRADSPLDVDRRVQTVALCREHELLYGNNCGIAVEAPDATPPPSLWQRVVAGLGRSRQPRRSRLVDCGLSGYSGVEAQGLTVTDLQPPGPWMDRRVRELTSDFVVGCTLPKWAGEHQDGGFCYLATSKPFAVQVGNAYAEPGRRSPHAPEDGLVGEFFDVLTLSGKRVGDGRGMARSAFVRELKQALGVKVTCRASWW